MPIILKEIRQSGKNYVDMLTAALTAVRQIMQTCSALSMLIQYRPLAVITRGVTCPRGRALLHEMNTTV